MKTNQAQETIEGRILTLLIKGLHFIFKHGREGHWGDVRSTSHAILLLSDTVKEKHSAWVNEPARWLVQQMRAENEEDENREETKSWESEVWDTALAIRAILSANVELHEKLVPSLRWIRDVRSKSEDRTWHDEPWETAHALFAIFETRKRNDLAVKAFGQQGITEEDIRITIDWYISLQDSKGKVITPHYTAFLLTILENCLDQFTNKQLLGQYQKAILKSTGYLLGILESSRSEKLWTSEAWSNGYVLQSLCRTHTFEPLYSRFDLVEKIVNWFETTPERNRDEGYWSGKTDIEDTAVALQGLWELLISLREITSSQGRGDIKERLRNEVMAELEIVIKPPKTSLIRNIEGGYYVVYISERKKKIAKWIIAIVVALSTIGGAIAFFDDLVKVLR